MPRIKPTTEPRRHREKQELLRASVSPWWILRGGFPEPRRDVARHAPDILQRFPDRQPYAALGERLEHVLGRDVAHEFVLRERTSAEPANGRIEAAAAGVVSGENLVGRQLGAAVQVRADF